MNVYTLDISVRDIISFFSNPNRYIFIFGFNGDIMGINDIMLYRGHFMGGFILPWFFFIQLGHNGDIMRMQLDWEFLILMRRTALCQ
jgi:hypothetical protein